MLMRREQTRIQGECLREWASEAIAATWCFSIAGLSQSPCWIPPGRLIQKTEKRIQKGY